MTAPKIVAHRGFRAATPENTMPAFAAAVKAGAQGIEMDVVMSADGVPVIIHDRTVDKTTNGSGAVSDMTVPEIKQLDAGSTFDPTFAGTRIPTFEEFAQFMAGHPDVEILLEFKGPWTVSEVDVVFDLVKAHGLVERSMLQSFHPTTIESIFAVAPASDRGVLIETEPENLIARATAAGIYTINPDVDYLFEHPDLADRVREAGMKMQVWTANDPAQWERLVSMGVDAIITDNPAGLVGWYAGKGLL